MIARFRALERAVYFALTEFEGQGGRGPFELLAIQDSKVIERSQASDLAVLKQRLERLCSSFP